MKRCVEIRSYNLLPGRRAEFHYLMTTTALPMLRRWQVDVVAAAPSPHDADSYYLIRAYADMAERQASQDAFYGSDEWRTGPRPAIIALIENYAAIVLDLEPDLIAALRTVPPLTAPNLED